MCALVDTTRTSVLEKTSAAAVLNWLQADIETRGKPPKERLAKFSELMKRLLRTTRFGPNERQIRDILKLNNHFRNNFAHFTPKGWAIEKAGLPRIIGSALDAVDNLMNRPRVLMHLDEDEHLRLTKALKTIRASLELA